MKIQDYFKKKRLLTFTLLIVALSGSIYTEKVNGDNISQHWLFSSIRQLNRQINIHSNKYSKVGVSVKDLKTGEYFSINGDSQFNPASVIKVPIMVEAFHQRELGKINFEEKLILEDNNKMVGSGLLQYHRSGSEYTVKELIQRMIVDSDNTATNMLIRYLGMDNINEFMASIGVEKTTIVDDTMLCKLPDKFNLTTPDDTLRILEMMYDGQLVSKKASEEMLDVLKMQKYKWGIPRYLPVKYTVANKTGSLWCIRNDAGIVFTDDGGAYAVTIFTKEMPSNSMAASLVSMISRVIYKNRPTSSQLSSIDDHSDISSI